MREKEIIGYTTTYRIELRLDQIDYIDILKKKN
jgi:hypothetical protein